MAIMCICRLLMEGDKNMELITIVVAFLVISGIATILSLVSNNFCFEEEGDFDFETKK